MSTAMKPADYALGACAEYEHWASECTRLTKEIGACECPTEQGDFVGHWPVTDPTPSCFAEAKAEEVVESSIGRSSSWTSR